MKGKQINIWNEGLDRDTSKKFYPNNRYYYARNIRQLSSNELSDGGIQTIEGNEQFTSITWDYYIIGWGKVGKWTVLFATKNEEILDDDIHVGTVNGIHYNAEITSIKCHTNITNLNIGDYVFVRGNDGIKYKGIVSNLESGYLATIKFNGYDRSWLLDTFPLGSDVTIYNPIMEDDTIWKIDLSDESSLEEVYKGPLYLSTLYPIYNEVEGYYVNEDTQKVYFTDGYNNLRVINIGDSNLNNYAPGLFDIKPDCVLTRPILNNLSGGSLPVGMVQYAFQLYRNDGIVTTYSPASQLIHLTTSSEDESTDINYQGDDVIDENGNPKSSGKSVIVTIDNLDVNYDKLRLVNIIYTRLNDTPKINIVKEISIEGSDVSITDVGSGYLGTISINEFRTLGGTLLTAQTIASKDNILFAGNTEEKYFDIDEELGSFWDARAYRFAPDQRLFLFTNANTTTHSDWIQENFYNYGSGTDAGLKSFFEGITSTADCANKINCPSYPIDWYIDNYYKGDTGLAGYVTAYQKDGTTLGGEGLNISYEFVRGVKYLMFYEYSDDNPSPYCKYGGGWYGIDYDTNNYTSYNGPSNPLLSGTFNGFKSDEIYSFAIIFYNDKGQVSFPKWIGDIRFPRNFEEYLSWDEDNLIVLLPKGIKFTVDTSSIPYNVTHYQIVRCERKPEDRTIVSQGVGYFPMVYIGGDTDIIAPYYNGNYSANNDSGHENVNIVYLFHSPDLFYNNNLENIDWVSKVGKLAQRSNYNVLDNAESQNKIYRYDRLYNTNTNESYTYGCADPTNVSQQNLISPPDSQDEEIDIGLTDNYRNWYYDKRNNADHYGPHCTTLVLTMSSEVPFMNTFVNTTSLLVDLKKSRIPYGGYGYEDRVNREYVPCSDLVRVTGGNDSVKTYEGDIFMDYFEYIKTLHTGNDENNHSRVFFPVESNINLKLIDRTYSLSQKNSYNALLTREKPGLYESDNEILEQLKPFYRYNSVYSQQDKSKVFFPKPNKTLYTSNKYLIKASNQSSRFSDIDEWTNFASGNELELEAAYGPLNKLFTYSDKMLFFQDSGMGVLSINERALQQSLSGAEVELGSSGVLARKDYISRISGSKHKNSIIDTTNGILWYDQHNRKMMGYTNQIIDIGLETNMKSYFSNMSDIGTNIFSSSDVIAGKNIKNNEIWITFSGQDTIIYNYILGKFISFLDNTPQIYIFDENGFFETINNYIYKYGSDNYEFYSLDIMPQITFIVSPKEFMSAQYDVITWLSDKYINGSISDTTIDSIKFDNNHQTSDNIDITLSSNSDNFNTRMWNRVFKYDTIRDNNDNHMTDYYLKVTMKWSNNEFILYNVETLYRKA